MAAGGPTWFLAASPSGFTSPAYVSRFRTSRFRHIRSFPNNPEGSPLSTDTPKSTRKSQIDALLLELPGVTAKKINNLDAYFVSDRMFVCISGDGIGLRLPVAAATELHFSRDNVVPFQPGGNASSREWIQINRADAADYAKDLELFQASLEFVKAGQPR